MLFRVCEHYDDNETLYDNSLTDMKDCFICFEIIPINQIKNNKLNNQQMFIKNCRCDGNIHEKCLKMWFDMNRSCPICRKIVTEKNNVSVFLINYIPFGNYIYIKINDLLNITRFIFLLFFVYNMFDYYLNIIMLSSKNYEDHTYANNFNYYYFRNESNLEI